LWRGKFGWRITGLIVLCAFIRDYFKEIYCEAVPGLCP
jgi:hypothetical protein